MLSLFSPFEDLMNDDFFNRRAAAQRAHLPAVDVREDKDAYVIEAELPGFKPEHVDINVDNGVLTITAERHFEKRDEQKGYQRIERRYGTFRRSFTLPDSVNAEHIDAGLSEGLLTVRIPKRETAMPRKIQVKGLGLMDKAKQVLTGEGKAA
jgi:HSP20 family protein